MYLIINARRQVDGDGPMLQSSGDVVYPFGFKQFNHFAWSTIRGNIDVLGRVAEQEIANDPAHQSKVEPIRLEDGLQSQQIRSDHRVEMATCELSRSHAGKVVRETPSARRERE